MGTGAPGPPAPPGSPEPPLPKAIEGRWTIDQTPSAGDKTGWDLIWENPEHGQKADTFFDVSFNAGSLKLAEGQQIQVYLDVMDQHGDVHITTAEPEDWSHAVTSRDPGLEVSAVSDLEAEGREQLVFDINDTVAARDLATDATIGIHWDAHDDLLI